MSLSVGTRVPRCARPRVPFFFRKVGQKFRKQSSSNFSPFQLITRTSVAPSTLVQHMRPQSLVALVSGGASGLGSAVAKRIVASGGRVLVSDLNGDAANAVAKELGPSAIAAAADCTSEADVSAALDLIEKQFGEPVSAAISTAGTLFAAKTISRKGAPHPIDPFEKVLKVNVVGSFNVARLAAQRMASREPDENGERGAIINTASIAAFDGQAGQAAYAASKGAIVGLTLPMARDLAPLGIRVCTIAPGIFETPMSTPAPAPCSRLAYAIRMRANAPHDARAPQRVRQRPRAHRPVSARLTFPCWCHRIHSGCRK